MNKDAYNFQKLTPTSNVELGIYGEALNFVFASKDIRNIAISGPYSAGKSSILETYKKCTPSIQCIHISLTHFESSEGEEKTEVKESVLEGKILNQLIHQIPSKKIPQTNFRVKTSVSSWNILLLTLSFFIFSLSAAHIFFLKNWINFVGSVGQIEYIGNIIKGS